MFVFDEAWAFICTIRNFGFCNLCIKFSYNVKAWLIIFLLHIVHICNLAELFDGVSFAVLHIEKHVHTLERNFYSAPPIKC